MKSVEKIYDIIRSVVLSGFILLFLIGGIKGNDNSFRSRDTHGATQVFSATTDLYSFATSTERCFENLQRVPSSPSKASFGDYLSVAYLTESNRSHLLTKDITFATYKVLRFQSHDIAFPFHFFW